MISREREVVEGWQTPHFDRNVFLNDFINKLTLPVHLEISIESKIGNAQILVKRALLGQYSLVSHKVEVVQGSCTPHFDQNVFLDDFINHSTP